MVWTVFEYLYRDAANFKAFGCVTLAGRIGAIERGLIRAKLESGEYFVAEQVGIPPLYQELYHWSNGPTASDHCWHEFGQLRETDMIPENSRPARYASEFVERFRSVTEWDISLSPHFDTV